MSSNFHFKKTIISIAGVSIFNNLKSRVVYKLSFNGCSSNFIGQNDCRLTTRIEKHEKQTQRLASLFFFFNTDVRAKTQMLAEKL